MTVCIATIYGKPGYNGENADLETGIVISADRMVSYQDGAFTYESKTRKIQYFRPHNDISFALMGTGAVNYIEDFFREFEKTDLNQLKNIEDVAKVGSETFGKMVRDSIEAIYLKPLSLDWKSIYDEKSSIPDHISSFITDGLKTVGGEMRDGLQILVAGIDKKGPHLFLIESFDLTEVGTLGYHAIGMGEKAARVSLESNSYSPFMTKNESLLLSLIAKFYSEKAFGVGRGTDCGLLTNNGTGIKWLTEEEINKIRKIYESQVVPSFENLIRAKSNKLDKIMEWGDKSDI